MNRSTKRELKIGIFIGVFILFMVMVIIPYHKQSDRAIAAVTPPAPISSFSAMIPDFSYTLILTDKATKSLVTDKEEVETFFLYYAPVGEKFVGPIAIDSDFIYDAVKEFTPELVPGKQFVILIRKQENPEILTVTAEKIRTGKKVMIYGVY